MKFGSAILVTLLVVHLTPSVLAAESDVVRVFDKNLRVSEQEMRRYLKEANLEKYGFTRSESKSTETDEDGKTTVTKTIHYMVTDDCSRVMFWEGVLEQRLPEKLKQGNIFSKTVKEMQSRIKGRKTEGCRVGLEIHVNPNRCLTKKITDNDNVKRGARRGCCNWFNCCHGCSKGIVMYAD